MPIDPSIILAATQKPLIDIKQPDQLEEYGKALRLKALMGQQSLQELQQQEARDSLQSNQRVRGLFADNPNATAADVMRIDPKRGLEMRKQEVEMEARRAATEKDRSAAGKSNFERHIMQLQHGAALLNTAKDQPSFEQAIKIGVANGVFPEDAAAKFLQTGYSPEYVEQLKSGGLKYAEKLKADHDAAVLAETARGHNLTNEATLRGQNMTAETARRGQNMTDARMREQIAAGRVPSGYRANPDGTLVAIPGGPADESRKPLTESQGKAAGLLHRATRANQLLNDAEDLGETNRGIIKQGAGAVPLVGGALEMGVNMLPGALGGPSANQQKIEQARRDFVNAALRVESGASISASEFANAEKQYFPMPGDSPEVIKQKREARQAELEALRMQSGPSAIARGLRPALAGNPAPAAGGVKFLGFE